MMNTARRYVAAMRPAVGVRASPTDGTAAAEPPRVSRAHTLAAAATGVVVLAAYSPVVVSRYGFIDDYTFLGLVNSGAFPDAQSQSLGRPLATAILEATTSPATTIGDLRFLRLGIIVLLALTAAAVVVWLARSLPLPVAVATGATVAMLPCFQVTAAWAVALPNMVAIALASVAALVVGWSWSRRLWAQRITGLVVATSALIGAFLAYQPGAMAFVAVALLDAMLRRPSPRDAVRRLLPPTGVASVAAIVGILVNRAGVRSSGFTGPRTEFVSDLTGKARWFFGEALPRSLDPLSLDPRTAVAWLGALVIIVGLFFYFRGSLWWRLVCTATAITGIALAYGPNLAIAENWAAARSLAVPMPYVLVLFVLGVRGLTDKLLHPNRAERAFTGLVVALALVAVPVAIRNVVQYFTSPQVHELRAIERRFDVLVASGADSIVFIQPSLGASSAPGISYDEFGYVSTFAPWVPPYLLQMLGQEWNPRWEGSVTVVPPGGTPPDWGEAVLDAAGEMAK